jgi:DNA recombination-dependent growth factor C
MAFLSSSSSISRYHIEGKFDDSIMENTQTGLKKHSIPEIENEFSEVAAGWTPFESPFKPDFDKFSFIFGSYFLFNLRIDKKSIPLKLIKKHLSIETDKRLEKTGRSFISKNEKSEIKDLVIDNLMRIIPSVPNIYEVLWNYEESNLFLFTTQKAANELFETIFLKSFDLKPIRLFPYTMIEKKLKLSDQQKDIVYNQSPLNYLK